MLTWEEGLLQEEGEEGNEGGSELEADLAV